MMQTTLVPGLLRAIATNRRHGVRGAKLFECGRGYFDFSRKAVDTQAYPLWRLLARPGRHLSRRARDEKERPTERHWLAGALDQPFIAKAWNAVETPASFFHGKATVLGLLKAFGIDAGSIQLARPAQNGAELPFLHPGAAAALMAGNRFVGYVGELHPRVAAALDLGDAVPVVFELDLEALYDLKGKALKLETEIRRFPPVTRDLAFLADKARTHQDFLDAVKGFKGRKNLTSFALFDVYEGQSLPADKKSMAYNFTFQSAERTLTDHEVEQEVQALVAWLGQSLQVAQRG
jgi:phenylalanyl-tRNA synthetase beta chain